ncbi:MAG: hypothetical protein QOI53_1574 [Verrucomicrobiota bacterium]|nr:hypothetical protein [Verrucomicrobiota bacterium]
MAATSALKRGSWEKYDLDRPSAAHRRLEGCLNAEAFVLIPFWREYSDVAYK